MIRLFIASPLSQPVRATMATMIEKFRQPQQSINWTKPNNAHLTFKFIGETDERAVPRLIAALDNALLPFEPIDLNFDRLGGFPNLKRPKIIYLGLNELPEALAKLDNSIETELRAAGFAAEKKQFRPHLTLGRVKRSDGLEELLRLVTSYQFKPACQMIEWIELIQSTLTPAGAIYRTLHKVNLAERFQ